MLDIQSLNSNARADVPIVPELNSLLLSVERPLAPLALQDSSIAAAFGQDLKPFREWLADHNLSLDIVEEKVRSLSVAKQLGGNGRSEAWAWPLSTRLAVSAVLLRLDSSQVIENIGRWALAFAILHQETFVDSFGNRDASNKAISALNLTPEHVDLSANWDHGRVIAVIPEAIRRARMIELMSYAASCATVCLPELESIITSYLKPATVRRGAKTLNDSDLSEIKVKWSLRVDRGRREREAPLLSKDVGILNLDRDSALEGEATLDTAVGISLWYRDLPLAVAGFFPESLFTCSLVQLQRAAIYVHSRNEAPRLADRRYEVPVLPGFYWAPALIEASVAILKRADFLEVLVPQASRESLRRFAGRDVDPARVTAYYDEAAQKCDFSLQGSNWTNGNWSFKALPRTNDFPLGRRRA